MNSYAKPKQFLELHGKPVILYTLEHFEEHPEIDNIIVVCIKSWIGEFEYLLRRYEYNKVSKIIPGGATGHESIYIGLSELEQVCSENDIILIHDGVRPLITKELISANIAKVLEYGSAITVEPVRESVVICSEGDLISSVPVRSTVYTAKAPQSFYYGQIWDIYQKAQKDGILSIDSAHLSSLYGVPMYTVESPPNNIKITAPTDYYIFRALYEAYENQQILGI